MSLYTRNCPTCDKILTYRYKHTMVAANRKNSSCASCTNTGENNPFYGKKHKIEHIENIKSYHAQGKYSTIYKIVSQKLKDRVLSDETKNKLSLISKRWYESNDNPMKGKHHTDETKNILKCKAIEQWDKYKKTDEYLDSIYDKSEYELYYLKVQQFTNYNKLNTLENWSFRNKYHKYELDHIYPISLGFKHGIPAELIGDIKNLRIIPMHDNRSKSNKLITIPEHINVWKTKNEIKI